MRLPKACQLLPPWVQANFFPNSQCISVIVLSVFLPGYWAVHLSRLWSTGREEVSSMALLQSLPFSTNQCNFWHKCSSILRTILTILKTIYVILYANSALFEAFLYLYHSSVRLHPSRAIFLELSSLWWGCKPLPSYVSTFFGKRPPGAFSSEINRSRFPELENWFKTERGRSGLSVSSIPPGCTVVEAFPMESRTINYSCWAPRFDTSPPSWKYERCTQEVHRSLFCLRVLCYSAVSIAGGKVPKTKGQKSTAECFDPKGCVVRRARCSAASSRGLNCFQEYPWYIRQPCPPKQAG